MSFQRIFQSLKQTVGEKLIVLNIYDTKSTDPTVIHRQILTTRLFLLLVITSIIILTGYTLISEQNRIETIKSPTFSVYKSLEKQYPESLQCPCERLSIPYLNILNLNASFHQVCHSEFVSQRWIDYLFVSNFSSIWPIDARKSLSTMWQLIKTLCITGEISTLDAIDQFLNTPMISSMVLPEQLLEATIEADFDLILQTASSAFMRPLITLHQITQANEFITALSINYIAVTSAFDQEIIAIFVDDFDINVVITSNHYRFNGSTSSCSCRYNGSCPMSANFYLYEIWERYGVYDFNTIEVNATLPGIVIDCLPLQTIFASTLQCFYQQSCLDLIIRAYQKAIDISILNQSLSSRFLPTTSIEFLIEKLFIEKLEKEIFYEKYYHQCSPIQCTFSYSRRFDITYVITTLLALFGGLTAALRLATPFIINLILFMKGRRSIIIQQPVQTTIENNSSIGTKLKRIIDRIKKVLIELNLFDTHSRDQLRIQHERITTRVFIILFGLALYSLIFYSTLATYSIIKTVQSPSQEQYEELLREYSTTLQCPCKIFSIPYRDFIEITPVYHQICHSDFIQPWWYQSLLPRNMVEYGFQFTAAVASHFRTLDTFCELANVTVIESTRQFLNRIFVNAYVLPSYSFNSQINASIYAFQKMARAEFLYTMLVTGKLIEANQYISNRMGSIEAVLKRFYPELIQSNLSSVRFSTFSGGTIYDNLTYCDCVLNSKCDMTLELEIGGIPQVLFSDLVGIYYGCFITESVLKSALLCWYTGSCIENLEEDLVQMGGTIYHHITPLDSQAPTRFPLSISTEVIFNELMIEQWHSSILYENFYRKCNPTYCTYSEDALSNLALIVTTVLGFIGGLNVILRLISPLIVSITYQFINRIKPQRLQHQAWVNQEQVSQNPSLDVPRPKLRSQLRQQCFELNLFDSESNNVHIVQHERWSTRIYLMGLFICIIIITMASILSKQTTTISVRSPTQSQYEQLLNSHIYTLRCSCSQVSIPYGDFITINATFHQVCSSEFIEYFWVMYLFYEADWDVYERSDIRVRGSAYFNFLKSICELSQTTVSNIITQFLTDTYIGGQAIPEVEFRLQMNALTQRFQTITPEKFSHTLIFMNEIAQSSGFISAYFFNWNWWMEYNSSIITIPNRPVILDEGCSCGTQNHCTQPGGVYRSFSTDRIFTIPGWNVGCSTIDTVLRSTLECFYNQTCVDVLYYYMTTVDEAYDFRWNTSAMNTSLTSRFQSNTIIRELVEKLFVEQWFVNVSYENFYEQCAPIYCSYTKQESNDLTFILARILGLYGGLTVALRFLIPAFIRIVLQIRNRFCRNTIDPHA